LREVVVWHRGNGKRMADSEVLWIPRRKRSETCRRVSQELRVCDGGQVMIDLNSFSVEGYREHESQMREEGFELTWM